MAIIGGGIVLVWGLVRGFPWFVTQTAAVNGGLIGPSLLGLYHSIANTLSGGSFLWLLLGLICGVFAAICFFNLKGYFNGNDAQKYTKELVDHLEKSMATDE